MSEGWSQIAKSGVEICTYVGMLIPGDAQNFRMTPILQFFDMAATKTRHLTRLLP